MYCIFKIRKIWIVQFYNSNTIIVTENCISAEILMKIALFCPFSEIFPDFDQFWVANMNFWPIFLITFTQKCQISSRKFFSNARTFLVSRNCIKNCIFTPKTRVGAIFSGFYKIVFTTCINRISAIVQLLYTIIVRLYCIWFPRSKIVWLYVVTFFVLWYLAQPWYRLYYSAL